MELDIGHFLLAFRSRAKNVPAYDMNDGTWTVHNVQKVMRPIGLIWDGGVLDECL